MEIKFLSRRKEELDILLNDVDVEIMKLNKYGSIAETKEIAE